MKVDIYWIPQNCAGKLAIMPRPRAGDWLEDELRAWRINGVDVVVSLLTSLESVELGLQSEIDVCCSNDITFISFPIPDRQVPASITATVELINQIDAFLKEGKSVAIHCRAGIGRSGLIAACALLKQGINASDAFDIIGKARGIQVPDTDEQRLWVAQHAVNLL